MLLEPVVPFSPVKVKDTIVEIVDWFVAIVTLDIWVFVMFPLIVRVNCCAVICFSFNSCFYGGWRR